MPNKSGTVAQPLEMELNFIDAYVRNKLEISFVSFIYEFSSTLSSHMCDSHNMVCLAIQRMMMMMIMIQSKPS